MGMSRDTFHRYKLAVETGNEGWRLKNRAQRQTATTQARHCCVI